MKYQLASWQGIFKESRTLGRLSEASVFLAIKQTVMDLGTEISTQTCPACPSTWGALAAGGLCEVEKAQPGRAGLAPGSTSHTP